MLCIPFLDPLQKNGVTEDSGVNTDPDWESQVAAMFEHSSILKEQYDGLMRKQQEEKEERDKDKQELLKKKEEAKRQHQVRLCSVAECLNASSSFQNMTA